MIQYRSCLAQAHSSSQIQSLFCPQYELCSHIIHWPKPSQKEPFSDYHVMFCSQQRSRTARQWLNLCGSQRFTGPSLKHRLCGQALSKLTEFHFEFQSRSRSFQTYQTCQDGLQWNVQSGKHVCADFAKMVWRCRCGCWLVGCLRSSWHGGLSGAAISELK